MINISGPKRLSVASETKWNAYGADTLAGAWIDARNECEQSGMRPVPDTLAVIAALNHAHGVLYWSQHENQPPAVTMKRPVVE